MKHLILAAALAAAMASITVRANAAYVAPDASWETRALCTHGC